MNGRLQIYVIYSLIRFKMKKIIVVFITFSGIYTGSAQNPPDVMDSNKVKQNTVIATKPLKKDSVVATVKPAVRLFPNPAKNKVEIEIKGFEPGNVQVQLIDKSGKLVRNDKRIVFSGNETIVLMFSEKPGLYFLLVKQGGKNVRSKLIIQ